MRRRVLVGLAAGIVIVCQGVASATPVQWNTGDGANGHWYEAVAGTMTWDEAKADAALRSWQGLPGHLVTITTQLENAFLLNEPLLHAATHGTPYQLGYWIGAEGSGPQTPSTYSFAWVNDEGPVNLTGWTTSPWVVPTEPSGFDPDDPGANVFGLHFFGLNDYYPGYNGVRFGWNDVRKETGYPIPGYLVEYENVAALDPQDHPQPTPEPATMLLLGGGIAGLAGFRARRRRGA